MPTGTQKFYNLVSELVPLFNHSLTPSLLQQYSEALFSPLPTCAIYPFITCNEHERKKEYARQKYEAFATGSTVSSLSKWKLHGALITVSTKHHPKEKPSKSGNQSPHTKPTDDSNANGSEYRTPVSSVGMVWGKSLVCMLNLCLDTFCLFIFSKLYISTVDFHKMF